MNKNYIQEAYESVKVFNKIGGNLTDVTDSKVDHQASLIFEELTETIDAIEAGYKVGILDGAIDLFVVVAGLMQKLEAQGYDVHRALQLVNDNNLSKYPQQMTDKAHEFSKEQGFNITYNSEFGRYIYKDENGKIRKPLGFTSVKLSSCVPKE